MKHPLIKALWLVSLLALAACDPQQVNPELQRLEARAQDVTIIRDDFGVPHIYARTDADAVFGLLYAQSEDDFNRVEQNYIWATGRLAEVEGEEALYSDLRARLYMTVEEAQAAYAAAPGWLQQLWGELDSAYRIGWWSPVLDDVEGRNSYPNASPSNWPLEDLCQTPIW